MARARRVLAFLLLGLVITHLLPGRVSAESSILVADLEGVPIPAATAGEYYCHDFNYPAINCFRTSEALEEAVAGITAPLATDRSYTLAGATAVSYVKVYDYGSYAGNYAYISQDYSNLGDIGWNNRIGSYIVQNSESGAFYTNGGYGGTIDYFCCNQGVASLGSTFDNQISSVRRT